MYAEWNESMCSKKVFASKRNQVKLREDGLVEKRFADVDGADRERSIYDALAQSDLCTPRFISQSENVLWLSYEKAETFAELLDAQEKEGKIDVRPWEALADWLAGFYKHTGLIQKDVNLRNFLYDREKQTVMGLDFEDCGKGEPEEMAASVMAFILLQDPSGSKLKKDIVSYLKSCFASTMSCSLAELERFVDSETEKIKVMRERNNKKG